MVWTGQDEGILQGGLFLVLSCHPDERTAKDTLVGKDSPIPRGFRVFRVLRVC